MPGDQWFARQFDTPPDMTDGHRRCLCTLEVVAPHALCSIAVRPTSPPEEAPDGD